MAPLPVTSWAPGVDFSPNLVTEKIFRGRKHDEEMLNRFPTLNILISLKFKCFSGVVDARLRIPVFRNARVDVNASFHADGSSLPVCRTSECKLSSIYRQKRLEESAKSLKSHLETTPKSSLGIQKNCSHSRLALLFLRDRAGPGCASRGLWFALFHACCCTEQPDFPRRGLRWRDRYICTIPRIWPEF